MREAKRGSIRRGRIIDIEGMREGSSVGRRTEREEKEDIVTAETQLEGKSLVSSCPSVKKTLLEVPHDLLAPKKTSQQVLV